MVFVIFSGFLTGFRCGFRWFSLVFVGWRGLPFGLQLFYRAFAVISAFWNTVPGPVFVISPGFSGHSGPNIVAKTIIFVIFLGFFGTFWHQHVTITMNSASVASPERAENLGQMTKTNTQTDPFWGVRFSLVFVHFRYFATIFDCFGGISRCPTVLSARFSSFSRGFWNILGAFQCRDMLLPAWFSSFSMDFRSHLRLFQCRDILLPAQFSSFPCGFRNILGPFQCRGVLSPTCPPLSMLGHVHAARRSSIPPFQCRNILIAAIACPDIERGR